jgi:hypothetical protein
MGAGENGIGSRLTEHRYHPKVCGDALLAYWPHVAIRSLHRASDRQADRDRKRIAPPRGPRDYQRTPRSGERGKAILPLQLAYLLGPPTGRRSRGIQGASMSCVPHPCVVLWRWLSHDPRYYSRSRCWRWPRRNNVLRSDLRWLAWQHPSRVIYPGFKRFVPAEINQRGDNKYLGKRAHRKAMFSKSRPGRKCC